MHVIGWPRLGLLLGPAVVRLTGGRTLHLVDKPQTARHFVARDLRAHETVQLGQRRPAPGPGLHHGGHLLAVTRIGHPDHQSVEHVGMPLQSGLDLFGVDLLAAAVDRHRATTQHGDRAVLLDLGVVPRNGVAHTVNRPERLGRLLLVLVVADGNVALLGDLHSTASASSSYIELPSHVRDTRRRKIAQHARKMGDFASARATRARCPGWWW